MKNLPFPLLCPALLLAAVASAQVPPRHPERVALTVIQTEEAVFPLSLRNSTVTRGEAKIAVDVDEKGQLVDWLVTGYSRKEFADAAVAVLHRWRYEPARLNGQAWASVQELHFDYTRTGVVVETTGFEATEHLVDELMSGSYAYRTHTLRELDRIPTPIQVVSPVAPGLKPAEDKRVVSVEFYIDEEGRVRLPSVARTVANDVYAASAMDAVKQWRFEPPLYKGRPVLVIVTQQFNFVAKS